MKLDRLNKWICDFTLGYEGHVHAIKNVLFYKKSKFQTIEIIDTIGYGLCLVLDGDVQSFEFDEFIYHEALVHPAMICHPNPQNILVIGGGEGAVLREALKYKNVESLKMVEIDKDVINVAKKYLNNWHQGSFSNSKIKLVYDNGRNFIENTNEKFDLIIIDLSNPWSDSPSFPLFTKEFYAIVKKKLNKYGIIVLQAGSIALNSIDIFSIIYNTIKSVFPIIVPYSCFVPSFAADWGFILAFNNEKSIFSLTEREIKKRIAERVNGELKLYDGITHMRMISLPKYVREILKKEKRTSSDSDPIREKYPLSP